MISYKKLFQLNQAANRAVHLVTLILLISIGLVGCGSGAGTGIATTPSVFVESLPVGIVPATQADIVVVDGQQMVKGILLVDFKLGTDPAIIHQVVNDAGGTVIGTIPIFLSIQAKFTSAWDTPTINNLTTTMSANPAVQSVTPDYVTGALAAAPTNDSYATDAAWSNWDGLASTGIYSWNLESINAPEAWKLVYQSGHSIYDVKLGVVDSSFSENHQDLSHINVLHTNNLNSGTLDDEHGTIVAGIMAATGDNNLGVMGVAWGPGVSVDAYGKTVIDVNNKIITTELSFYAAFGALVASANPPKVINFSIGGARRDPITGKYKPLKSGVIQTVRKSFVYKVHEWNQLGKDILFVQAAGNDSKANDVIDAYATGWAASVLSDVELDAGEISEYQSNNVDLWRIRNQLMVVGAIVPDTKNNGFKRAVYSAVGVSPYVSVWAPGGDNSFPILSTGYSEAYMYQKNGRKIWGTSVAAPHVAGLAGLIWQVNEDLYSAEVKNIITGSATQIIDERASGVNAYGPIMDAYAAVKMAFERRNQTYQSKPSARMIVSKTSVTIDEIFTLDGTTSYDPDGEPIDEYIWSVADASSPQFMIPLGLPRPKLPQGSIQPKLSSLTHAFAAAGEYYINLTVRDPLGNYSNQATEIVGVHALNPTQLAPSVQSVSPASVTPSSKPQLITLSGSDFDAKPVVYIVNMAIGVMQRLLPITATANSITVSAIIDDSSNNWTVVVANSDHQLSNKIYYKPAKSILGGQATVDIKPLSIDFGSVPSQTCVTKYITISNQSVTQSATGSFTMSPPFSSMTNGFQLIENGSDSIPVKFCPSLATGYTGIVTFNSATTTFQNNNFSVALTGTGIAPTASTTEILSISPQDLQFGDVPVGTCVSKNLQVSLVAGSKAVQGAISILQPFTTTGAGTFNVSLTSPTASIPVSFCPTNPGLFTSSSTVNNNNGAQYNNNIQNVTVTANAVPSVAPSTLSITPSTLDFGNVEIGACSPSQDVLISLITGNGAVQTGNGPIQGNISVSPPFRTTTSTFTASALGTTRIPVSACPTVKGLVMNSITVTDSSGAQYSNNTNSVTVQVNGVLPPAAVVTPVLSISQTNINFGNIEKGTCATQNFQISLTAGSGSIQGNITVLPPFTSTVSTFNVSPTTTAIIPVNFCPSISGAVSNAITVSSVSNAQYANGVNTVAISATGVAPTVTTISATQVTPTSAMLNSSADALGKSAFVFFQCSTSTVENTFMSCTSPNPSSVFTAGTSFNFPATQLTPNTTYYYRAVMIRSLTNGTTNSIHFGAIKSFTTPPPNPQINAVYVLNYHAGNNAMAGGVVPFNNAVVVVEGTNLGASSVVDLFSLGDGFGLACNQSAPVTARALSQLPVVYPTLRNSYRSTSVSYSPNNSIYPATSGLGNGFASICLGAAVTVGAKLRITVKDAPGGKVIGTYYFNVQ